MPALGVVCRRILSPYVIHWVNITRLCVMSIEWVLAKAVFQHYLLQVLLKTVICKENLFMLHVLKNQLHSLEWSWNFTVSEWSSWSQSINMVNMRVPLRCITFSCRSQCPVMMSPIHSGYRMESAMIWVILYLCVSWIRYLPLCSVYAVYYKCGFHQWKA